ncbi:MAG TPA: VOC family protein [Burkholderiales bacterium]|nr:VOC family protein [Burkholderiales bacterium]
MASAASQRPPPGELCLDHLGHFVPDLDAAAAVWEKLGFKVTPTSVHQVSGKPAGTSNRCVMLEEGYLELLAPTLDTPNAQRVRHRMQLFVGVHLACFGTPDAAAEQRRLADHGFEPEPVVHLQRTIDIGESVGFRVVYVPPGKMPEGRVQYCEHLTPEHVWREGFVNPFRLRAVYVVADAPEEAAARWGRFGGLLPRLEDGFVRLDTARGRVMIGTRKNVERMLGKAPAPPALAGYALACAAPDAFAARCRKAGLEVAGRVVTLPASLGGLWLLE